MVAVAGRPSTRVDKGAGEDVAVVSRSHGPSSASHGPIPCWTGESGLPDELWEKILAHAGAAAWARARSTCQDLRVLGMAPSVLRAQQERWGVGHRPVAAGRAPDFAEVVRLMARRRRLEINLARRQLYVELAPALEWAPRQSVVLPGPALLTIDAEGLARSRPLAEGLLDAPAALGSPVQPDDGASSFRFTDLRLVTDGGLGFASPPSFFHWRQKEPLTPMRGWLDCGAGGPRAMAISADGRRGLALVGPEDVVAGNQRNGVAWRWRPEQAIGWRCGQRATSLVAGALPGGGDTVVLLDDAPALTGWRLGDQGPALMWGPLPLAGPADVAGGMAAGDFSGQDALRASPDGRHLVALPPSRGPRRRLTLGAPSLLRLAADGSVAAGPWLLQEAGDGDDPLLAFSLDSSCLAMAVPRIGGGFQARHWRLDGGPHRPPATLFAAAAEPIAHLALSPDGTLAAVSMGSYAVMGAVSLWRLDRPRGPRRVWTFQPGALPYAQVAFSHAGDELILVPAMGGALVLRLAVDGRAAEVGESFVAPARAYRAERNYCLDDMSRLRLRGPPHR